MGFIKKHIKNCSKAAYINLLPSELLEKTTSIEVTKSLFSHYVQVVELENHNYCNRICWFCPNAFLDRRKKIEILPQEIFESIINDLASIDFRQTLVWSMYHEPLAHNSIFERIQMARDTLPEASLVIFSNGDYLNRDTLRQLENSGLDRLVISLYVHEGEESYELELKKTLDILSKKTGLEIETIGKRRYELHNNSIKITMNARNFTEDHLSSRGGLINIKKHSGYYRNTICLEPVRHVAIDYNGKCLLCCQTRLDSSKHKHAMIGDLKQHGYTVFHYYRDLAPARRSLLMSGHKHSLCLECNSPMLRPDSVARREWLYRLLQFIPLAKESAEYILEKKSSVRTYEGLRKE